MATQEQIHRIFRLLKEAGPGPILRRVDESNSGAAAVLGCLYHAGSPLTAGQISREMHVSTARMAVLLRKLEQRGLLTRTPGQNDARTVEISLTDRGLREAQDIERALETELGRLIDRLGEERLAEFALVAREIGEIMAGVTREHMERVLDERHTPEAKEMEP